MKELLFKISKKDFELTWFSGSGCGGQNRNKNQNCCRLKHLETGIIAVGQSNKSRNQNKKEALENLVKNEKWKLWHKKKCSELLIDKNKLEEDYQNMCKPENFKYEIKIDGVLVEVDEDLAKFYQEKEEN